MQAATSTKATRVGASYPTLFGCAPGAGGRVIVLGVPYDRGTDGISGAAKAPSELRSLSAPEHNRLSGGALYDLATGQKVLEGDALSDIGDLPYRPTMTDEQYLDFVARAVEVIARERKSTMALGGDHLVTLAVLRGIARGRDGAPFQVVHVDAHFDYGAVDLEERPTHGSFMSFVAAEGLAQQITQVGVRGYCANVPAPVDRIRLVRLSQLEEALLPGVDVYLTIDTDAFDPAAAPAVSYPVPGGLAFADLDAILAAVSAGGRRLIGADWTEYNPAFDPRNLVTGRTVVTALVPILARLAADAERP